MSNIKRILSACEKPKVANATELPLAPEQTMEIDMLRRCGALFESKSADDAVVACLDLANGGDSIAQADVGLLYVFSGTRMAIRNAHQPHMALAAGWLQRAADQGDAEATAYLGQMYLSGAGVEQDRARALALLHAAAEQGSGQAYFGLGMAYERGTGVAKSYEEAEKNYRLAETHGNKAAGQALASLRLKMNPTPPPPLN